MHRRTDRRFAPLGKLPSILGRIGLTLRSCSLGIAALADAVSVMPARVVVNDETTPEISPPSLVTSTDGRAN